MENDEQENEQEPRNGELPHIAEEGGTINLVDFCTSLKVNQPDRQDEHRDDEDVYEPSTLIDLTVERYEGETCEGLFHGQGFAWFEGGHIYKGSFSRGLMDGYGVFTGEDGLKYEGEFVCNIPMGKGTYTWPDGSSYEGDVDNGIRHGTGTYTCASNGVSYTGHWDQGMSHGKGTVYYNQDKTSWYEGDWVRNNKEGWGVRRYPSGSIYSGEWKNNLRHGEGTMRWLTLEQQYIGTWQNGVQHGHGTHVCAERRSDGSQYSQSNQYTGDFVHGHTHGQGTLYYASGAVYEERRGNQKHGKAKVTFEDGQIFEGKFVDDQIMTHDLHGIKAPSALPGDMTLNIECLLEKIPERMRDIELKLVEFAVLRQAKELRSVYSFYSRLSRAQSLDTDNTFLLTRLQFCRLLKDCNIHHHDISLTQLDHFMRQDSTPAEIHSPFASMLLHEFLSCLVIVAYHIYHKDMVSQNHLLAACFSKLMTDNILPNSKNVKGFLFRQPDRAVVSVTYSKSCWETYQTHFKVSVTHSKDRSMTYRHLLWMFKDLSLLDTNLTTERLLQVITAESRDPSNLSGCLNQEITFLEFFEVLLGSAEVKCHRVSEGPVEDRSSCSLAAEASRDADEVPSIQVTAPVDSLATPDISSYESLDVGCNWTSKSCDIAEESTAQDVESQDVETETEVTEKPHSAEQISEEDGVPTRGTEAQYCDAELWSQTIHLFFNHFFFPAFEHNQLVSRKIEVKRHREDQRHSSLVTSNNEPGWTFLAAHSNHSFFQVEGALRGRLMTRDAAHKPDEASFSVPELSTQSKNKPMPQAKMPQTSD